MRAELKRLRTLLQQKDWSVPELVTELRVSRATAYRLLDELAEYVLIVKLKGEKKRGPPSKRYCLARSVDSGMAERP